MELAILDGVVAAVVLISALLAMFRGFVREVLSIAAWVAAAILAYLFYEDLLPYVAEYVSNPTVAIIISAAAIFLVSLIVVSLITMRISDFVMDSPVGALDRLLGFIFGAARGVLLLVVAALFFNYLVDEPDRPEWVTTAMSYPELSRLSEQLLAAIPDDPEAAIRGALEGEEGALGDEADDGDASGTIEPEVVPGDIDIEGDAVGADPLEDGDADPLGADPGEAGVIEEDRSDALEELLDGGPDPDASPLEGAPDGELEPLDGALDADPEPLDGALDGALDADPEPFDADPALDGEPEVQN